VVEGGLVFRGRGGDIDGLLNPRLAVPEGVTVELTLVNADGMEHDWVVEELGVATERVSQVGETSVVRFTADRAGTFAYFCSFPGHRPAGMEGLISIGEVTVEPVEPLETAPEVAQQVDALDAVPTVDEELRGTAGRQLGSVTGTTPDGYVATMGGMMVALVAVLSALLGVVGLIQNRHLTRFSPLPD
jgi:hypothetical protein